MRCLMGRDQSRLARNESVEQIAGDSEGTSVPGFESRTRARASPIAHPKAFAPGGRGARKWSCMARKPKKAARRAGRRHSGGKAPQRKRSATKSGKARAKKTRIVRDIGYAPPEPTIDIGPPNSRDTW